MGRAVGHRSFRLGPDELIRVEFWGVAGESLHMEPRVGRKEGPDHCALVDGAAVPQEDDVAAQVAEELSQEGHDVHRSKIRFLKVEVEGQVLPLRRHGDR